MTTSPMTEDFIEPALSAILQSLDVDLAPLHEQAWLWAASDTCRFRSQPQWHAGTPGIDGDLNTQQQDQLLAPTPVSRAQALDNGPLTPQGLRARLGLALDAWVHQPLVWRIQDGVAQAVLMGELRFTWSCAQPQGRVERYDRLLGWAPGTFDDLRTVTSHLALTADPPTNNPFMLLWRTTMPFTLHRVLEQIGRHAQRHQERRRCWVRTAQERDTVPQDQVLSWWPWPMARLLSDEEHRAVEERGRRALGAFLRALQRLHPFWRTVHRAGVRSLQPPTPLVMAPPGQVVVVRHLGDPLPPLSLMGPALGHLLADWDAWAQSATEHPRAALLLPWALRHRLPPGIHAWRDDVWSAVTSTPRATWKAVRESPLATVKTLLRQDDGMTLLALLPLLERLDAGPIPVMVLRQTPSELWTEAIAEMGRHAQVGPALKAWPVRRAKAFLDAVRARTWADQRVSITEWLQSTAVVLDWTMELTRDPFPDPSWGWGAVVQRWLSEHRSVPAWPVPFRRCLFQDVHVSVVDSDAEWRMLGNTLHNCLKDGRSNGYRRMARDQTGLLVRLNGRGRSAAFLTWVHDNAPSWRVSEHRADHNQGASPHHQQVIAGVVQFLNASVTPDGLLPKHERDRQLTGLAKAQRFNPGALLGALNESWGIGRAVMPGWNRPVARGWAWLNDDRWWSFSQRITPKVIKNVCLGIIASMAIDIVVSLSSTMVGLGEGFLAMGVVAAALRWMTTHT